MDLNSAKVFINVVQTGGFSAASRQLNVPVATVSRRVSELEKSLDVRLLERSTRSVRLTEAGAILYEFALRGLEEFEAGMLALTERENELRGTLRVSLPPSFEPWWLLLNDFQKRYPNINIDVNVTERKVDLIEDGIDVALRVGDLESLSAVGRKLCSYSHRLVATAEFIKQHGQPAEVSELANYPLVAWGKKDAPITWRLGEEEIRIQPKIKSNDYSYMRHLLQTHQFITELPPFLVDSVTKQCPLIEILPQYPFPKLAINLLYPSRKQLSRIVRAYIGFCFDNVKNYIVPN